MIINGQETKLAKPVTLAEFLREQGYDSQRIAVERNGEIIPRANHQTTRLSDADTLEIVHFVGGG